MGFHVRWNESRIQHTRILVEFMNERRLFPFSNERAAKREDNLRGFMPFKGTAHHVPIKTIKEIFSLHRHSESWIELIVVANGDQLSGRQVEHRAREWERRRDQEAFKGNSSKSANLWPNMECILDCRAERNGARSEKCANCNDDFETSREGNIIDIHGQAE